MQASRILNSLWESLTPRQKEVVMGRFGLDRSGKPQTLAALGERYGITRERVRQIEASALDVIQKKVSAEPACLELIEKSKKYLKDLGGVARKDTLLAYGQSLLRGFGEQHLSLLVEATRVFHFYPEDKNFFALFYLDKPSLKTAANFINQWISFLRGRKEEALKGKYQEYFELFLKRKAVPKNQASNYLALSKKIAVSPYGDVGLAEWPEVDPRTIRDKVYLVLRKRTEPLHFRAIARAINEMGLGKRQASAPTVHNELIKDKRFVLVGRGIYALAENGYEPGTAKEVIHRILKKQGPLRPRDVILAIQKERFFKPNTVLVNLQNKSFFERLPDGTYRVREA